MYKRVEYQIIKSRLEEDRMFIQVVMGPRQVGKSTVVKQVLDDLPYLINFIPRTTYQQRIQHGFLIAGQPYVVGKRIMD